MSKEKEDQYKAVVTNRKAYHDYFIEEKFESGVILRGTEVKSLRAGRASLVDAFGQFKDGMIFALVPPSLPSAGGDGGGGGAMGMMRGMRSKAFSSGITTSVMTRSPSPSSTQRQSVEAEEVARTW